MLKLLLTLCTVAGFALSALPAHAQNARSWLASNGADGNPCTRSQPCATLSRAYAVTNARGEINCVDAADYHPAGTRFDIAKSVTIDCTGTGATLGFADSTNNGNLWIYASGVTLRGLTISGGGVALHGVIFGVSGTGTHRVLIENVLIHGFTGRGIWDFPNSGGSDAHTVVLNNVHATDNAVGVYVDTATAPTPPKTTRMVIKNSNLSGNTANGLVLASGAGGTLRVVVENSVIAANSNIGILVNGADAMAIVSNSTITTNATGVTAVNGGQILSYGNNRMHANVTANGAFTGVLPLQ